MSSRRLRITRTGAVILSGGATGFTIAKMTKCLGAGIFTATKTGVGAKAAPVLAVIGAMAFLSACAIKTAIGKKKYNWQ